MYKDDLALNTLQVLICHKNQPTVGLGDNKYSLISRTLLSILADFNITMIGMVSILPVFSKFLGTVTSAPSTIGITVTFSLQ